MDQQAEERRIKDIYRSRAGDHRYAWSEPGQLFMMQSLERRLLRVLRSHGCLPLDRWRILEMGCGNGHFLRELVKWGAAPERVTGIDLLPERIDRAAALVPRQVTVERGNASATRYPDGAFDMVLQMTLFTSILSPELRRATADEMRRVLAPGGCIIWYDFRVNNPRNPNVRAVGSREIRGLFPGCRVDLYSATIAPPIARRLARWSWTACSLLDRIPPVRTHYIGVIRPRRP